MSFPRRILFALGVAVAVFAMAFGAVSVIETFRARSQALDALQAQISESREGRLDAARRESRLFREVEALQRQLSRSAERQRLLIQAIAGLEAQLRELGVEPSVAPLPRSSSGSPGSPAADRGSATERRSRKPGTATAQAVAPVTTTTETHCQARASNRATPRCSSRRRTP